MEQNDERASVGRKHLLTAEQLASHAGASAEDLAQGHRQGNGIRIHRTYIIFVSLTALVMLGVAIAVASATM